MQTAQWRLCMWKNGQISVASCCRPTVQRLRHTEKITVNCNKHHWDSKWNDQGQTLQGRKARLVKHGRARQSQLRTAASDSDRDQLGPSAEVSTQVSQDSSTSNVHLITYHTVQQQLSFKYPRARKMLLVCWCMAFLKSDPKSKLSAEEVYTRYCMDLPQKQRVPAADFQDELLKALALLDIRSQHTVSGDRPVYKRIVWASIPLVTLLAGMLSM